MVQRNCSLALAFDVMLVAPVVVTLSCARYFQGSTRLHTLTISHFHTLPPEQTTVTDTDSFESVHVAASAISSIYTPSDCIR